MGTVFISKCCREETEYGGKTEGSIYICPKCGEVCDIEDVCSTEDVCSICLGTGEVPVGEVDENGNVREGVGTQRCLCRIRERDDEALQDK